MIGVEEDEDEDDPVVSIKSDHTQSEGHRKGGTLPINRDGSLDYDGNSELEGCEGVAIFLSYRRLSSNVRR